MSTFWVELLQANVFRLKRRYETRVIEAGSGEPLILLHGTGGHAENYVRNIGALARRFHVFAIDFLWHGRSQTGGFDPEILPPLVDQVEDVMDALSLPQAAIEGQSLGGWVAMLYALTKPERVSRLILTTPMGYRPDAGAVPGFVEPDLSLLRETTLQVLADPSDENIRARLARILADPSIISDESVKVRAAFYRDPEVNAVQRRLITHYLGGPEPQRHIVTDALARRIRAPTLVYWGEKNYIPAAVGEHLARTLPDGSFYCAPNTGHWAQFENHEIHNREVLRFLEERA
jgi:2-hydroxy-6-oxonona-2,4-dienedioate hydrolase